MRVRYLGHAGFELRNKITILIDPYFTGNEKAPKYTGKPDLVLSTHEHFDHADTAFVDALGCRVFSPPACNFRKKEAMKVGEKRRAGGADIEMFSSSHHQSKYPTGYIIEHEGKRIAHLGDTYLDGVQALPKIDLLLLPIGGYYTMDIAEAVEALKIIKPKLAIPMHYGTFPQIIADPEEFKAKADGAGFKVKVLKVMEELAL